MEEKPIGKIIHYYDKIDVAIVELSANLKVGDTVRIKSHGLDFTQPVASMQIEHQNIDSAKKGDVIGMKVDQKIKEGGEVYLVKE